MQMNLSLCPADVMDGGYEMAGEWVKGNGK